MMEANHLAALRKERAAAQKERDHKTSEYNSLQYAFTKAHEKHLQCEKEARALSAKLEQVNHERLQYRSDYDMYQAQIQESTDMLNKLKGELTMMKSVVNNTIRPSN